MPCETSSGYFKKAKKVLRYIQKRAFEISHVARKIAPKYFFPKLVHLARKDTVWPNKSKILQKSGNGKWNNLNLKKNGMRMRTCLIFVWLFASCQ